LVLRTDLSGDPTFAELLERTREVALGAYAHQDLPFEKLVEELKPPRDLSISPVFQVSFSMQDASVGDFHLSGLDVRFPDVKDNGAKFDLSLYLSEGEGEIGGELNYASALFDGSSMETMIAHYLTLLGSLVAAPDEPISRHHLISPDEQRALVEDLNPAVPEPPSNALVHELVAAHDPGRPALVDGERTVTFGDLDRRAAVVAARLQERDVGPGDVVAVLLPRSVEQVAALLGVLKAGAAYLPLDPEYPKKRLSFMLEDARPNAVVEDERWFEGEPGEAKNVNPAASDLAYVIYTSGSTGEPKGVAVTHANLAHLVDWHVSTYGSEGTTSSLAPLSFDASVWELWPALAAGMPVVLVDPGDARDLEALVRTFERNAVTTAFVPTATARALLRKRAPAPLETLLTGGDRLTTTPSDDFGATVVNHYGPTETTVVATAGRVDRSETIPHIGTPIRGTRVYVLDEDLNAVPRGLPGEIYIGGRGVARGYLGRPDLTAERFLPDPFSSEPGARMYRSGDRARYRKDGALDFLGRADEQVKVRGYRIEPAEVQAALRRHPSVEEAVVAPASDASGRILVAYLTGAPVPSVSELRAFLAERLPAHMIPAAFVPLDELPLTPAGKVDRAALPAPGPQRPDLGHGYEEPVTETEKLLAEIWSEVLGVERVGRTDNFFDLGGHSLL
ncbi:MAG: amino acid adenylation domain-containing protein, partial [Actinomycetota bacterium]|nr:amino acid adenylation domain-containing protein [Actinomycetota bacterium]